MPNLSALSKLSCVSVAGNRFEFDDLMPANVGNPGSYHYSPQQKFGKEEIYNKLTGEALTFTATVGGTGNLYQWYKDGTLLNGKINKTLDFKSIALTDEGSYTCKVINPDFPDLTLESNAISVFVTKALIANAGTDQSVNELSVVTLDGSGSYDPDGLPLTYKWSAPAGITLSSTTIAMPTFTAPDIKVNTSFAISLVVNNGIVDSPVDQVKITVKQVNIAPVANAGSDQSVNESAIVSLDGSASTDADGNTLTYKWSAPAGITLSSTTDAKPTFTAPEVTANKDYTILLVVNDGTLDSPADPIVITVKNVNKVPVANAGSDQSVNEGTIVTLDGSASSDPDGNPLTYKWSVPDGITLTSTTVANPTFTAPEVTADKVYTISLVVNNGTADSPTDQVVITVKNVDHAPSVKSALQDVSVEKGAANQLIDLKTVFTDSDVSDVLSFAVTSNSNNQVVNATISNSDLTLNFSTTNTGIADIVITATSNGKEVQSKFKVEVKLSTGINTVLDDEDVQIYPNPTTGIIHLKFNKIPKPNTSIFVLDSSGKVILKSTAEGKEIFIDLTGNSSGLYLIRINQKTPATFKIILE